MVMPPDPLLLCDSDGDTLGDTLGETLGDTLGETLGEALGDTLGEALGEMLGDTLGEMLGEISGPGPWDGLGVGLGSVVDDEPGADTGGTEGIDGRGTVGREPDVALGVGKSRPPPCPLSATSRCGPPPGPHSRSATPPKTPRRMAMPAAAIAPAGRRFGGRGRAPRAGGSLGPPATPARPPSSAFGPNRSSRSFGSSLPGSGSKALSLGARDPIPFLGEI
jgi:hypothetical protein